MRVAGVCGNLPYMSTGPLMCTVAPKYNQITVRLCNMTRSYSVLNSGLPLKVEALPPPVTYTVINAGTAPNETPRPVTRLPVASSGMDD